MLNLDFCPDIQIAGSEFSVNNVKSMNPSYRVSSVM